MPTEATPAPPIASDEVTQEDREAAAAWFRGYAGLTLEAECMAEGLSDHWPLVQAFARHRIAAERRLSSELAAAIEARDFYAGQYADRCGALLAAEGELAAMTAERDAALEALRRLRDLTPNRANATNSMDLHITVRAIAESAIERIAP